MQKILPFCSDFHPPLLLLTSDKWRDCLTSKWCKTWWTSSFKMAVTLASGFCLTLWTNAGQSGGVINQDQHTQLLCSLSCHFHTTKFNVLSLPHTKGPSSQHSRNTFMIIYKITKHPQSAAHLLLVQCSLMHDVSIGTSSKFRVRSFSAWKTQQNRVTTESWPTEMS